MSKILLLLEGEDRSAGLGFTLWLVALNPSVLEVVKKSGFADKLGPERLFYNARTAIRYCQDHKDDIK